ncbi:MAG: MFS transporter [Devosia sp.]|nr:MFS transporter [Devosia sp.]
MDTRLLWLALGGFAGALESFLLGSLLPGISADMGVTIGQVGLVVVVYALVHGFGTPVLTALFGGTDRRKLLGLAELTFAAAALCIALSPEFGWLFAARVALAVGAGLYTVTALATAVAMSPPERRGRAIGIVVSGQSLAVLAGVPLGALMATTFGWRSMYFVIAALGLMAATALLVRLPAGLSGDKKTLLERLGVVRVTGMPLALLTTFFCMVAAYMPLIYVAPLSLSAVAAGQATLPLILLANGIGGFAGSNLGGRIADRVGVRRALLLATGALVLITASIALVPYLPEGLRLAAFLMAMGLAGFVGWGFWPAQSSRIAGLAPGAAPLALALNGTALNAGVALSAAIGSFTIDNIGAWGIPFAGLPFAIAALFLALLFREKSGRQETAATP